VVHPRCVSAAQTAKTDDNRRGSLLNSTTRDQDSLPSIATLTPNEPERNVRENQRQPFSPSGNNCVSEGNATAGVIGATPRFHPVAATIAAAAPARNGT
jgi:hypothetical protein